MGAYVYQLSDARADIGIRNVAGTCANTPEFSYLINKVTRILLKRGAWWGTETVVKLCVYGCRIVWPRYVGTVEGIRFCRCNGGQADIQNNWYAILGPHRGRNWQTNVTVQDDGVSPFHNDITGNEGKYLRYHVVKPQDLTKSITFYGKQYGGQPLQELDAEGVWQNGLTLWSATPIAQTSALVTTVKSVKRMATEGMAYVYQYDGVNNVLYDLAVYEPNETNPSYRVSKILNLENTTAYEDSYGRKVRQIEALVKLRFIPVENDRDFLLIDDMDALAFGIQAVKFDEANDPENAEKYWAKAIRELNFESRDKNPGQQFVSKVRVMGSDRVVTNPV
jgi:hypothetical protein